MAEGALHRLSVGRWFMLLLLAWLAGCALQVSPPPGDHRAIGQAIQAVYEAALPELPHDKQRHYAQRLYRISGDARYLGPIEAHGRLLLTQLERDISGLEEPGYASARAREIVANYPRRTAKQRARQVMLAEWGEIAFGRQLLFRLIQADYYGLLETIPDHERALDYLASLAWQRFLTDPEVMRLYTAQVANQAWFLHQLAVVDLRQEMREAFHVAFPPHAVAALDQADYRNRLYGMTHIVIADSRYYQGWVPAGRHAWILDAFAAEIERILDQATEDIQAEVALSFLLTGQENHPVVARIRQRLVEAIDPATGIIPSPKGETDLARGEHRNVLAFMVLTWPGRLYPGPDLSRLLHQVEQVSIGEYPGQLAGELLPDPPVGVDQLAVHVLLGDEVVDIEGVALAM
ncbi:DUF3541 domain-containing protein [Halomonas sp. LR3S48]|uniref:DUF3541 domain-containing protein n=1 Tax=Halomonas sp. LR3S48 TaxID=2982694 RepID=UPI0021E450AE|nr:DUF3541 domain-containing protein [Halomonas sp. LR3S48]UYG03084.1 DUF3541 domain-containing protein [Halomonas sp. LR3S48]